MTVVAIMLGVVIVEILEEVVDKNTLSVMIQNAYVK